MKALSTPTRSAAIALLVLLSAWGNWLVRQHKGYPTGAGNAHAAVSPQEGEELPLVVYEVPPPWGQISAAENLVVRLGGIMGWWEAGPERELAFIRHIPNPASLNDGKVILAQSAHFMATGMGSTIWEQDSAIGGPQPYDYVIIPDSLFPAPAPELALLVAIDRERIHSAHIGDSVIGLWVHPDHLPLVQTMIENDEHFAAQEAQGALRDEEVVFEIPERLEDYQSPFAIPVLDVLAKGCRYPGAVKNALDDPQVLSRHMDWLRLRDPTAIEDEAAVLKSFVTLYTDPVVGDLWALIPDLARLLQYRSASEVSHPVAISLLAALVDVEAGRPAPVMRTAMDNQRARIEALVAARAQARRAQQMTPQAPLPLAPTILHVFTMTNTHPAINLLRLRVLTPDHRNGLPAKPREWLLDHRACEVVGVAGAQAAGAPAIGSIVFVSCTPLRGARVVEGTTSIEHLRTIGDGSDIIVLGYVLEDWWPVGQDGMPAVLRLQPPARDLLALAEPGDAAAAQDLADLWTDFVAITRAVDAAGPQPTSEDMRTNTGRLLLDLVESTDPTP